MAKSHGGDEMMYAVEKSLAHYLKKRSTVLRKTITDIGLAM